MTLAVLQGPLCNMLIYLCCFAVPLCCGQLLFTDCVKCFAVPSLSCLHPDVGQVIQKAYRGQEEHGGCVRVLGPLRGVVWSVPGHHAMAGCSLRRPQDRPNQEPVCHRWYTQLCHIVINISLCLLNSWGYEYLVFLSYM